MISDLQKANILKRLSAWILDIIIICILATGAAFLVSRMTGFDERTAEMQTYYQKYESLYNVKFNLATDEYQALTEEELSRLQEAEAALIADKEAMHIYSLVTSLTLVITSVGIFLAVLISEFIVPLILKNGQTVGKKIFGIGVMSAEGVKLSSFALFVRSVLGKYTLEMMAPIFIIMMIFFGMVNIVGTLILFALLILQIVLLGVTKTNAVIHDLLAGTVVVDLNSQMIYDTYDELIAHKKAVAAEQASANDIY